MPCLVALLALISPRLALFVDQWRAMVTARDNPDVMLEALPAGGG